MTFEAEGVNKISHKTIYDSIRKKSCTLENGISDLTFVESVFIGVKLDV